METRNAMMSRNRLPLPDYDTGRLDSEDDLPVLRRGSYGRLKPAFEWVAAALMLVALAPIVALAMLLVKLTSPGPAIYSQLRVGKYGQVFRIFKIRSMTHECERDSGVRWAALKRDPRVTPVGAFLRATHVDELPQLWNVLRGEMSLIGPRPERPEFVVQLEKVLPRYHHRHLVRPGITGLAQIQLPPDTDVLSVGRKLTCDLHYVRQMDALLDAKILICTGLGILSVPFGFMRRVFLVPSLEEMQRVQHEGTDPIRSTAQVQPA